MTIIAVMAQKGGVGKTTTATSLAWIMATQKKQRVLLIDGDQQGNASQIMGTYDPEDKALADLLTCPARCNIEKAVQNINSDAVAALDVVSANSYLMDTNIELATDPENDQVHRLEAQLEQVREEYDIAIIDCGLTLDMMALNALTASDLWIVPCKPGGFEADALLRMIEQLDALHDINPRLELRALPCIVGKSKAHQETIRWIRETAPCFDTTIRRTIVAEKYSVAHMPLPVYSPRSGVVKDYAALADEIMQWIKEG